MMRKEGFVRVQEAAELLGVCPNTIRAWGAEGKLTEYRHPLNNYRLFKRSEIDKVISKVQSPPKKRPKPK